MSDSFRPHGLKHARLPCPSPTLRACSNPCPLSQWCHPTISSCCLLLFPASIFPIIRVFSNKSVLPIRWPKYWSFSFNISPSDEYSGLISFRMDWLDLLAVQGTLMSLQHHSSKASIVLCSAFFIAQLSCPYMITGKTIALTRWTFVGRIMSPLLVCCLGLGRSPEKEMATHSSVLAWRIPGTAEPGGLSSMGSHRVRHDWSNLAAAF